MRTQRILGELIREGQQSGELRKPTENQYSAGSSKELAEIGLNKKQSHTFQQIADIPEKADFLPKIPTVDEVSYVRNTGECIQTLCNVSTSAAGKRIVYYYRPCNADPDSLHDVWNHEHKISISFFVIECIRNGVVIQDVDHNRLIWAGQAVTLNALIDLFMERGVIKKLSARAKFLKAFNNKFDTPRITNGRALRQRRVSKAYRTKYDAFRRRLKEIFFVH